MLITTSLCWFSCTSNNSHIMKGARIATLWRLYMHTKKHPVPNLYRRCCIWRTDCLNYSGIRRHRRHRARMPCPEPCLCRRTLKRGNTTALQCYLTICFPSVQTAVLDMQDRVYAMVHQPSNAGASMQKKKKKLRSLCVSDWPSHLLDSGL